MRSSRRIVAFSCIALLLLAIDAGSQIEISQEGADTVRVRFPAEAIENLGLEASTNLQAWELISTTNSNFLDFVDPDFRRFSMRFFRAFVAPQTNRATLQITSPANNAIVETNRPAVEVAFSGFTATTNNLVLRLQGTNVPTRATIANDRATFELLSPLSEGFVTLVAAYVDTNSPARPVSRVSFNVRTTQNNLLPTAQADFAYTTMGVAVAVLALANDKDPNGDTLSISSFTQGTDGTVSAQGNNALIYAPAVGFFGKDRFSYTIDNDNNLSGDFPHIIVESASLRMRGNHIDDLDFAISGNFGATYGTVENNTFGGAANIATGESGYLRLANNSFGSDGIISDAGFLVNDPGSNSINTENISSPLDFNGDDDNCADYPTPEFTGDPSDPCSNGPGDSVPGAPNLPAPAEPPWPAF